MGVANGGPLVSVVMPCLNEEAAIGPCIEKIHRTFASAAIDGEIVVCDNGSTDASVAIAERLGARVVHQPLRGYGNAYLKGFASARASISRPRSPPESTSTGVPRCSWANRKSFM